MNVTYLVNGQIERRVVKMIKFTNLTEKLPYPPAVRAKLSSIHSDVITYVVSHYDGTASYRQKVVNTINTLSYIVVSGDSMPIGYNLSSPLNINYIDDSECKNRLGLLYVHSRLIDWDIAISRTDNNDTKLVDGPVRPVKHATENIVRTVRPTPKEDLYLKPPTVPQFDYSKPYVQQMIGQDVYCIYTSLPEIPTKQNEISVTTDINRMTYEDLMKLYPNQVIHTRSSALYEHVPGLDYDERLGLILPVQGFTKRQILDNIVRYPHIFKISKLVDNDIVSFYTTIEIDGELHKTLDIWDTLPESKKIPKSSEFIKEYVIRRYLLERDIKKIQHKYPIYGTLDEFLTLFAPSDDYISMGYKNTGDIAKKCVLSRISFKTSRNPVLRRLSNE